MESRDVIANGRRVRLRRAGPNDVPGIVHAVLEGSRAAFGVLPDGGLWVPKLYADMASRLPGLFEASVRETMSEGRPRTMFVAETHDGRIAGMIDMVVRADRTGHIDGWYALPEFHGGRGIEYHGPSVGRALMHTAIGQIGGADLTAYTTAGTKAVRAYLSLGFEIDETRSMAMSEPFAAAGCPPAVTRSDGTVVPVGRQDFMIRRQRRQDRLEKTA